MPNSTMIQSIDAYHRPVGSRRPKAGELGRIAASSGRGETAPKKRAFQAPRSAPEQSGGFGLFALALAILAAWAVLVGGRAQVVSHIPAMAPAYAALGLPVNLRQMNIEGVVSKLMDEDGRRILVVEGEIRNLADGPRAAPRMRLSVVDSNGQEIYFWTAAPPKSRLLAGETASFRARLAAPPQDGREVRVRFAGNAIHAEQGS
jgi:hypothetical protein